MTFSVVVVNAYSKRSLFNKEIQENVTSFKIMAKLFRMINRRTKDQSGGGDCKHQQPKFRESLRRPRYEPESNDDAQIQRKQPGDRSADPAPHAHPDNGEECWIE